jgi:transcriptional regulator with XRE-family HTH domain
MAQERERLVSPNEIVSYNLRRARDLKGWTQERAAEALEPFLGVRWTGPSFSVAERWKPQPGQKVRQFGADEVVAIAAAFELPIGFFFRQPPGVGAVRLPGQIGLPVDRYAALVTDPQELRHNLDQALNEAREKLDELRARVAEAKQRPAEEQSEATSAAKGGK